MHSQCPTADQLALLLKDELSQAERTLLEAHVQECTFCREQLNVLSGGDASRIKTATEPDTPEFRALLARLKPEESGDRLGPYKLLQQIGEGGFGTVWMAEQAEPVKRRVALKIIKLGMDTKEVIARFEQERQALAMMDHSNIAKVFDAGATQWGRPFFVMELVRGMPMTEYCDEQKLSVPARLALFIQVCQAVQHAHQKGIIHRDLKPSNILISAGDDHEPVPKIIDFGVAKAMNRTLTEKTLFTQFEQMIGTPTYMSPEQAGVGPMDIDTRSDIYSLGVLLYELLTGKPPFDPDELRKAGHDEMRRVIREEEPPRPSTRLSTLKDVDLKAVATRRHAEAAKLASTVRGDLDWIVMKALEKNRNRRYETANGLAVDLRRHLGNEPVLARPPSFGYKAEKFIRRYKGPVAAAAAVLVALIAGLAASTLLYLDKKAAWKSEAHQRHLVEEESKRTQQAVTRLEIARAKADALNQQAARSDRAVAESKLAAGDGPAAFAHLARACEFDPTSILAAEKAVAALNEWQHPLPVMVLQGQMAAISADGSRILTVSTDKSVRVWDAASGGPIATVNAYEGSRIAAQFSSDGSRLVTSADGKTARVWDAASGKLLLTLEEEDWVFNAQFSPDSSRVVTALGNGSARIWNVASGKPMTTLAGGPKDVMEYVQFSPDGSRLVTGWVNGPVRIWNVTLGIPIATLPGRSGCVTKAHFSRDGSRLVTVSYDETARVWNANTGDPIITLAGHEGNVLDAQFSADGSRVVTASQDKTARIWETASGTLLATLVGHRRELFSASFNPDGSRIVTASDDKTARVWDTASGRLIAVLAGHGGSAFGARFSQDGSRIFTTSDDGTTRVWDNPPDKPAATRPEWANTTSFSRDGSRVVGPMHDNIAVVWDRLSRKIITTLVGHTGWVNRGQFSADGSRVVTASQDKTSRVWETVSGRPLAVLAGHTGWVNSAEFSADGARTITTSHDGSARIWDAASGILIATLGGSEDGPYVTSAQFNSDGSRIVTAAQDGTARIWDAASGKMLLTLAGHSRGQVNSAQFGRDGLRIITAGVDKTARLWDAASGKFIVAFVGHEDGVSDAQFSPDGSRIVTASEDATARLWHADSGELIATLVEHGSPLLSASFSPDGSRIVTASRKATERTWNVLPSTAGPPPTWFPGFLRYLAQARLNPNGEFETLNPDDWRALGEKLRAARLASAGEDTPYLNILHRFVSGTLELKEEILALRQKLNGLEHTHTLHAMIDLVDAYSRAGRKDETFKMGEKVLAIRRKVNGRESPDTRRAMQDLYRSYRDVGLWDKALPLMAEWSTGAPDDTVFALKVSTLQAWFGKKADHTATCKRVMDLAAATDDPSAADRAAKGYCLLPSSDPHLLEASLVLARRAFELGKDHQYLPYYQMSLGMAEYRKGNYKAADELLVAAEKAQKAHRHVREAAPLFHAMSLFRQGKQSEARKRFSEAVAQMRPLPADERQPLSNKAESDDIVIWLAYKEAKALLAE